jgi:hypothetical protein
MIARHSSARNGRLVMLVLCTSVRAAPDNSALQPTTQRRHVIRVRSRSSWRLVAAREPRGVSGLRFQLSFHNIFKLKAYQ